jgi:DNA-binding NtrC family response regulator
MTPDRRDSTLHPEDVRAAAHVMLPIQRVASLAGGYHLHSESRALPARLRVLLVEDEPLIGLDAEAMLLSMGVEDVTRARNVAQARRAIETGDFQAAILDVRLGQESSLPLAELLAQRKVPFGFATGYFDGDLPAEVRSRPIISKPFTEQQLGQLLYDLIGS